MKDFDIEKIVSELNFSGNSLNDFGNGILLTNYEVDILNKYNINFKRCIDLKEILYFIESLLNEDNSLDDLEEISKSISERDYYSNTNK